MNVFNIHLPHHGEEVTLTILSENNIYHIIYNGGVIGAIHKKGTTWEWLAEEEIPVEHLPLLADKKGLNNEPLPFGLPDINQLTVAIEQQEQVQA